MEVFYLLVSTILGLGVGLAAGIWLTKRRTVDTVDSIKEIERLKKDAQTEAERLRKEARIQGQEEIFQLKKEAEKEIKEWKVELRSQEGRLQQKEQQVNRKYELVDHKEIEVLEKEKALQQLEHTIKEKGNEIKDLVNKQRGQLEKISGMSVQEAKDYLLETLETEVRQDASKLIKKIETETNDTAEKRSKEIISLAISRYAGEYIAERTVSVVHLPSDEMKGRIIGREGRNIRAIEAATGIDLIIDDTPEAVLLSGFNSVRREVARIALERLVADGRIHPARIEEVVKKVEKEIDTTIRETGEQAAFDIGAYGIHAELIKLLGKLRFRTSYAQNVLQHSIEVAFLCGIMASELGINVKKAKRAGLLHDIGKAVDHEVEGPHAIIGADLAKKYGESQDIVHAISAHHEDVKPNTVMAVLVQAADALSGARPGARREMLESYVRRLEDLEGIAKSFTGVQKSYAIQAGREIRIVVLSDKVSDVETPLLCREVAKKIESELSYPGQIKVTVIRETRAVEYAK
ncbi:MAG: ribonuclease Y [Deltaproteobacteria bacterium]|nr:ribonuclease Y [Deltaproteobacteria bacterium]MBW1719646.1 ribonuclease Y [Deltaproteobacteria bacterium]MBW1938450.1 ribonuclease Y [Deltaproteobacteria bacterium]MBW1963868.1 ribonuclease Y [Deltaproteobacteria bacterium]MBW2079908.1 ribonuclease Y [Deltaproteobacteria bacterium]